jgi:hypothetical protein
MKQSALLLTIAIVLTGCNTKNIKSLNQITHAVDSVMKTGQSAKTALQSVDFYEKKNKPLKLTKLHTTAQRYDSRKNIKRAASNDTWPNLVFRGDKTKKLTHGVDVATAVNVGIVAGTALAIIGGKLADYFTEQDKQNATRVLQKKDTTKSVAWCSGSEEISDDVNAVQCAKTHKIIQTPGKVTENKGKICRTLKTEIVTAQNEIKTEEQQLCQAEDGEWYDAKTA